MPYWCHDCYCETEKDNCDNCGSGDLYDFEGLVQMYGDRLEKLSTDLFETRQELEELKLAQAKADKDHVHLEVRIRGDRHGFGSTLRVHRLAFRDRDESGIPLILMKEGQRALKEAIIQFVFTEVQEAQAKKLSSHNIKQLLNRR